MKRVLTLTVLLLTAAGMYAQHISEEEALERALLYMGNAKISARINSRTTTAGDGEMKLESSPVEAEGIYAYNIKGGGFIIASADSRTLPVLGYSDNGHIDWDNLPENIRAWFKQYDEAIATLGNRTDFKDGNLLIDGNPSLNGTRTDRETVEPFITTHWNQFEPYYDLSPLYAGTNTLLQGRRCMTGCPATSIAQILNYNRWPESMPDGLPGYYSEDMDNEDQKWYVDSLPPVTFDYDNMLNDYHELNPVTGKKEVIGSEAQRKAVATLMRYCGQAIGMAYGTLEQGGSGAYMQWMFDALTKHLGYPATADVSRSSFTIDEWEDIVYNELASKRPVLYTGYSDTSGHSFVCDGYDAGLFHINWGWSGECDGYYSLSVLNPDQSTSAANGSPCLGYSIQQELFIYLSPDLKEQLQPQGSVIDLFQNKNIIVSGDNAVSYYYIFDGEDNTIVDHALGTIDDNGQPTPLYYAEELDTISYAHCNKASNAIKICIDSTDFLPGDSVTLYPMLRLRMPGAEWKVIPPTLSNVVTGRTAEGLFFMTPTNTPIGFKLIDGAITNGTGRLDEPSDIAVSISNQTPKDLTYKLKFKAYCYGDMKETDITKNTPYLSVDTYRNNAYIRSWQEGKVTFRLTPKHKGLTCIKVYTPYDILIGKFYLELTNDTLVNYSKYIENRSSHSIEDDKYYYNIELCDTTSNGVPDYVIPSDSIIYRIRCIYNDKKVKEIIVREEIREYLKALSAKNGKRGSIFRYQAEMDFSKPGVYWLESYLCDEVNGSFYSMSCFHSIYFKVSEPTDVKPAQADTEPDSYYDILGRPVSGFPDQNGIYITNDHKKIIINNK